MRRFPDAWTVWALLVTGLLAAPLAGVGLGLFRAGPEWGHVSETVLAGYLRNTLGLAAAVGGLSLLLAVPAAWLLSAFEFPGRRWLEWAMVLPLSIPTYVAAFVYMRIPEAAIPWLVSLRRSHGVEAYLRAEALLRHGLLALLLASVLYPYLYLSLRASFLVQRRGVVEAAHSLGRGPASVFFSVALPLARPALIAGLSLIVMEVVNDYGAVHFFGVPTLTEGVFRTWFGLGDRRSAVRLAAWMMVGVLGVLAAERAARGRARYAESAADPGPSSRRPLRAPAAAAALLACLVPLSLGFLFPVGQLLVWAARSLPQVSGSGMAARIGHSLGLSSGAALVLTGLALLVVYARRLHPGRPLRQAAGLASLGYAVPGAVVAIGVLVTLSPLGVGGGGLGVIFFAYGVRFFAVPSQPLQASMTRVCGSLDEASRLLGHPPLDTLRRVNLPLVRGSLLAATMLVFVDILKELPLTMILRPVNFDTLATLSFGLAKEGRIQECAVPALLIVLLAALGLAAMHHAFPHERRP